MDNIIHNRLTRLILEKHAIKGCKRPFYVNIPSGVPNRFVSVKRDPCLFLIHLKKILSH